MNRNRLEAFSDGVLAIILTIMVLELKTPVGNQFTDLIPVVPTFISYILSFTYVGIYWNNHHHLLQTVCRINGKIMWSNLHFLFWLSLLPFTTAWLGNHFLAPAPAALYCFSLFMASITYNTLQGCVLKYGGVDQRFKDSIGRNYKGNLSVSLNLLAVISALFFPIISIICIGIIAIIWFIPDLRIEKTYNH